MAKGRRWRAWVFLVCWIALTCFAMTYDFHPGRLDRMLERGGDKIIHRTLFTVMGLSAQAAAPWISLLVTGPFAVGLEVVQKKLPGRQYNLGGGESEPEPEVAIALRLLEASTGRILWTGALETGGWDRAGLFRRGRVHSRGDLTARVVETLVRRLDRENIQVARRPEGQR